MLRQSLVLSAVLAQLLHAADTRPAGTGPLSSLPSVPGPHIAAVRAMPADSWMNLGTPAADPKWGVARGRSWTPRTPFAHELRAAFLCGCGIHGYVKPDGHFMDDLWAYDINAHRWLCLYPGAHVKTLALKLDKDGFEVNADGENVPVSFMSHGYCNQPYIPRLGKVMFIFTHSPWCTRAMPQRWDWLDQNDPDVKRRNYGHAGQVIESARHPLFYDVASGKWERRFVAGDGPGPRRFEGVLEYCPTKKQAFFHDHGRVWFYDFAEHRWLRSPAERVDVAYDSWGCYDTRRNRIYVARKELFLACDIATDRWLRIRGHNQPADLGSCAYGAVAYDSAADAVVFFLKALSIHIYDPDKNVWRQGASPPRPIPRSRNIDGFYDSQLDAHFYHIAGDSDDDGVMFVYRLGRPR